jgi:adenylate cyclase
MSDTALVYRFDDFTLDQARGLLLGRDAAEIALRPKSFALLCHLAANPGQLRSREQLLDTLWPGLAVSDDSLTQCVSEIRRAFGSRAAAILTTLPKRGYVFAAAVRREEPQAGAAPGAATALPRLHIAPLAGQPGDATTQRLAYTTMGGLIDILAHAEGIEIALADDAMPMHYRLCGEVRNRDDALRVTLRLEDVQTEGVVLWSDRIDHPVDVWPRPPKEALDRVAGAVERQIARDLLRKLRAKPEAMLTQRELCLLGREHLRHATAEGSREAMRLFRRAAVLDPGYAAAFGWQASVLIRMASFGWEWPEPPIEAAMPLARHAVELAPDSPFCLSRLAYLEMLLRNWDVALGLARQALNGGRRAAQDARGFCTLVLAHSGHPIEAVETMRALMAVDTTNPPASHQMLGLALLLANRHEEALLELRLCAAQLPEYEPCLHSLLVAAHECGKGEDADAVGRTLRRLRPGWSPEARPGLWNFRNPGDVARFEAAFRAHLPPLATPAPIPAPAPAA